METTVDTLEAKRDFYLGEVSRLQKWLAKNKTHPKRAVFVKELEQNMNLLRRIKDKRRRDSNGEKDVFYNIVCKTFKQEIIKRIKTEVTRCIEENSQAQAINGYLDDDYDVLFNKYPELKKQNEALKSAIFSVLKELDSMMIDTKNITDNQEYHRAQEFNKTIIRSKSKINNLIK